MGSSKYQATVYLSAIGFDVKMYVKRDWVQLSEMSVFSPSSFSGDCIGITFGGADKADIMNAVEFVEVILRLYLMYQEIWIFRKYISSV